VVSRKWENKGFGRAFSKKQGTSDTELKRDRSEASSQPKQPPCRLLYLIHAPRHRSETTTPLASKFGCGRARKPFREANRPL
jgi:hypothetical protein